MSSETLYRQLVLFYADNINAALLVNRENLTDIPATCDFCIFVDESNVTVRNSVNQIPNQNQIKISKSSEPVKHMLSMINENLCKYSLIIIVCNKNIIDEYKWNKSKEVQMNTMIKRMEPLTTTIGCIRNEFHRYNWEEKNKGIIVNDSQFPAHSCPRCSEAFHQNDDLKQHDKDEHFSVIEQDIYRDFGAKISFNGKKDPDDRWTPELYCMICERLFQTLESRIYHANHFHAKTSSNK